MIAIIKISNWIGHPLLLGGNRAMSSHVKSIFFRHRNRLQHNQRCPKDPVGQLGKINQDYMICESKVHDQTKVPSAHKSPTVHDSHA